MILVYRLLHSLCCPMPNMPRNGVQTCTGCGLERINTMLRPNEKLIVGPWRKPVFRRSNA